MGKVIELDDKGFARAIEAAPLAFVDFYASWCGPCRLFAPVFAKMADQHQDAFFFKIDGDLNPESRSSLNIENLPFIAAYKHGKLIDSISTTVEDTLGAFIQRMKSRAQKTNHKA